MFRLRISRSPYPGAEPTHLISQYAFTEKSKAVTAAFNAIPKRYQVSGSDLSSTSADDSLSEDECVRDIIELNWTHGKPNDIKFDFCIDRFSNIRYQVWIDELPVDPIILDIREEQYLLIKNVGTSVTLTSRTTCNDL
eukprot:Pompholyxophrys_sp_v1_NODE_1_length_32789_cov_6.460653.p29 type:complete len:138 gc:universal NODE_1_length_32789_cov_6.460653:5622-5209(-)